MSVPNGNGASSRTRRTLPDPVTPNPHYSHNSTTVFTPQRKAMILTTILGEIYGNPLGMADGEAYAIVARHGGDIPLWRGLRQILTTNGMLVVMGRLLVLTPAGVEVYRELRTRCN